MAKQQKKRRPGYILLIVIEEGLYPVVFGPRPIDDHYDNDEILQALIFDAFSKCPSLAREDGQANCFWMTWSATHSVKVGTFTNFYMDELRTAHRRLLKVRKEKAKP